MQRLFSAFTPQNYTIWAEEAIKVAKITDLKTLYTPTYEGIVLEPFYNAENQSKTIETPIKKNNQWLYFEYLYLNDFEKLQAQSQEAFKKSADGLIFESNIDNEVLLKLMTNTNFKNIEVKRKKNQLEEKFLTKIDTAFPWIKIIIDTENSKDFRESIEIISPYKNIGVRIIEGNFWGNKGANAVQSLAFGLSAWVESLDIFTEKNNSEKKISNCQIGININENYFMEMAKIRALRILTTKILETYHSKIDINILSLTQKQNLTNIDEYNNLLRLTTEAMAGILGGTDGLCILPYQFDDKIEFSAQISRNISHLLRFESYLDKVTDAAKGSYYIESLTTQLTEKSFELFLTIEKMGGYSNAYSFIESETKKMQEQKEKDFQEGKKIVVGVNKYQK
ncbi:MAG: hypothetical protein EAZ85_00710 [Bacteroidetes bacterium]|nr:MAG: hypothetical protein EAZ85_00710 [Bacteroidota bacterium]TAG87647.1 MAG: hypothetical protein EAZ20_10180 [Bacteroidota bacterium]